MTDAERRRRDKDMIEDPGRWPRWPTLPLKNPSRFQDPRLPALGWITPDFPTVIVHAGPGLLANGTELAIHQLERHGEVNGLPTTEYADVDTLLDDGWVVD